MSQPHSIVGKIAISEASFKKYLSSSSVSREEYADWKQLGEWSTAEWLEEMKKDEGKDIKEIKIASYWADKIDAWVTVSPEDVLIFSYDKNKEEVFFYHIIRFDWWTKIRNELTVLRQIAKFAKPKEEGKFLCLNDLLASSSELASSSIKSVLTISDGKSKFIEKNAVTQDFIDKINQQISTYLQKTQDLKVENIIRNKALCYPFLYKTYQKDFDPKSKRKNLEVINLATKENPYWFNKGYYTDGKSVYALYLGKIEGAEPLSFKPLKNNFSKDKNHAYLYTWMIPDSDGATFKLLKDGYSFDKNNLYYDGHVVESASPDVFKLVGVMAVSNGKAFYRSFNIPVDEVTFSHYKDSVYYMDKNHVYALIEGELRLISSDVKAFEILYIDNSHYYTSQYAKDSQTVFYEGKKLDEADPKMFHMKKSWGVDANYVWYTGEIIPGAEAKLARFDYPFYFFTDSKNAYYCGKVLPDLDIATFEVLGDSAYAKDKNHLYFMNEIIEDVDKETFEVKSWNEAKDSRGRIYTGRRL